MKELRRTAKATAIEAIGEALGEVEGAAKRGVEELRAKLMKLFDRVMRKAAEKHWRTKEGCCGGPWGRS
mgnify:CR=1 FL=1